MASFQSIGAESIQAGVAPSPALATVDVWPSLDPTAPFSLQSTGINNFNALTNQLGLFNGLGLQNQIGADTCFGFGVDVGGACDAQGSYESSAPSIRFNSPDGTLSGAWEYNGFEISTEPDQTSDVRLKENIQPLDNSLDKILNLQGVSFNWKEDLVSSKTQNTQIGLIAQEVEKIIPEVIGEKSVNKQPYKSINYGNLTAVLIEAIKEQQEQINALKETVEELSTKLAECCS